MIPSGRKGRHSDFQQDSGLRLSIGRAGFRLVAVASTWNQEEETYDSHSLRAEFVMDSSDADAHYLTLLADKESIESAIGEALVWHQPEGKRARKVYVRRSIDLEAHGEWPGYQEWLIGKLERLYKVFGPKVKGL
jgi:hypothetical protein